MDKFKGMLHKMNVIIENNEGISMNVFKALRYGLVVAIDERDRLKPCEGKKQPDTESKLNIGGVINRMELLIPFLSWIDDRSQLEIDDYKLWVNEYLKQEGNL
jgi:hypothetical protein